MAVAVSLSCPPPPLDPVVILPSPCKSFAVLSSLSGDCGGAAEVFRSSLASSARLSARRRRPKTELGGRRSSRPHFYAAALLLFEGFFFLLKILPSPLRSLRVLLKFPF